MLRLRMNHSIYLALVCLLAAGCGKDLSEGPILYGSWYVSDLSDPMKNEKRIVLVTSPRGRTVTSSGALMMNVAESSFSLRYDGCSRYPYEDLEAPGGFRYRFDDSVVKSLESPSCSMGVMVLFKEGEGEEFIELAARSKTLALQVSPYNFAPDYVWDTFEYSLEGFNKALRRGRRELRR